MPPNEQDERKSGIDRRALSTRIAGLDLDKGIRRFGDDEDAYFEVLRSFAANTPPLLEKVTGASKDTLADYAIVVHGIKGSSRSICADVVGDMAETLENAAKSGDYDFIATLNAPFLEAAYKLVSEIDAMLTRMNTDSPKERKDAPDKELLNRILEACKDYDMDTLDAALEELESYEYESGNELVAWLWENAQQFNIEQIVEKLSDLPD